VKLVLATLPKEDHGPECLVNNKQLFNLWWYPLNNTSPPCTM
jgi:hypothetical protein